MGKRSVYFPGLMMISQEPETKKRNKKKKNMPLNSLVLKLLAIFGYTLATVPTLLRSPQY